MGKFEGKKDWLEVLVVDEIYIQVNIKEIWSYGVYEVDLFHDNDEAWNFSNRVMKFTVPLNSRYYLTIWVLLGSETDSDPWSWMAAWLVGQIII